MYKDYFPMYLFRRASLHIRSQSGVTIKFGHFMDQERICPHSCQHHQRLTLVVSCFPSRPDRIESIILIVGRDGGLRVDKLRVVVMPLHSHRTNRPSWSSPSPLAESPSASRASASASRLGSSSGNQPYTRKSTVRSPRLPRSTCTPSCSSTVS
jgi:hypothetical protein